MPDRYSQIVNAPVVSSVARQVGLPQPVDLDRIPPSALLAYPLIVTRADPAASRPPAAYRVLWQGRYYQVWGRRPGTPAALEHVALAGIPGALDELHDADAHAMAQTAHHHAEGSGRFALAGAGMDDDEAALLGLGSEDLGARRLALGHLLGMAAVHFLFAVARLAHGDLVASSSRRSHGLFWQSH